MADIPQELIIKILLWMPVKSILRFRCLSKPLCAVIDNPDFTDSHLVNSSQNFKLRKLIYLAGESQKFHVCCDVNLDVDEDILHLGKPVSSTWREIRGNCNGLLLVQQENKFKFSLWNPSTRKYWDLRGFPFDELAKVHVPWVIGSGLVYDDSTNDYKVILMVYLKKEFFVEIQVWIYGFKSNIWRRAPNLRHHVIEGIGYFADGSLHWIPSVLSILREAIMAFDVEKEEFSIAPQPVRCSINSVVRCDSSLHVLEGCLCIGYLYYSKTTRADLYIRKKDGVDRFSWTMLFSVTIPFSFDLWRSRTMKVFGYSNRGDKILLDIGTTCLVSYDPKKKSLVKVDIDKDRTWKTPFLCLESLASVGGGT